MIVANTEVTLINDIIAEQLPVSCTHYYRMPA